MKLVLQFSPLLLVNIHWFSSLIGCKKQIHHSAPVLGSFLNMILGSAQLSADSRILKSLNEWFSDLGSFDYFIAACKVCKKFAPQLLNKAFKIITNHYRTCKKHCVKLKVPKRMYYFLQRNRSLKPVNAQSYFCFTFRQFLDLINNFLVYLE